MATESIPRDRWTTFFDHFSKDYRGSTAVLEVIGIDVGDQIAADEQVFNGISADEKDGENRIAIQMGSSADDTTSHAVEEPTEVWLSAAEGHAGMTLDIRAADGVSWLLRFPPPARTSAGAAQS
jgi:hypothetical protein